MRLQANDGGGGGERAWSACARAGRSLCRCQHRWRGHGDDAVLVLHGRRALPWALSQTTENRKVEGRKPLIFRNPIFGFALKTLTLRQSCHAPWGHHET